MLVPKPTNRLIAHHKALEAASLSIQLVAQLPAKYRALANQVIRAAGSVPANLAEGQGRNGGDRLYHWRVAYGSAVELDTHLRLLVRIGALAPSAAASAISLLDEVRAMTWRLLHPKG